MINQEEIYRLLMQKDWAKIIRILHKHQSEIEGDAILLHAAKTFESEFIREMPGYYTDKKEITDVLGLAYTLHHGKFYTFIDDNIKIITLELARRAPLSEGYNYAKRYPDEQISKTIISRYETIRPSQQPDQPVAEFTREKWIELFNRIFEMINITENTSTYFSGPKF